jgi:peptidoglycan/LPS O-acetylase OafA/YrhL
MPHLRALDGLRGVAVAAVVVYHLDPGVLPGGFLGVDMFFVLSGFLIASLVVRERQGTGRLDLRNFYVRRLRRLTPALLLVIAAMGIYGLVAASPGELERLRVQGLWTLGWMANWRFIIDGTSYTDFVAGVSPLRHMWSLAIEEQFYLLFPLLVMVLAAARLGGSTGLRTRLVVVASAGAVASAVWMVVVHHGSATIERAYFGTDTRAHGLLIGVALGALLVGRPPVDGRAAVVLRAVVVPAVVVLVVLFAVAAEGAAWMYRGGFVVMAVATAVIIASVGASSWLASVLGARPLVGLGIISYGVYLWHWPVITILDSQALGLSGFALAMAQVAITLGCALVSFVVVERPVRSGALGRLLGPVSVAAAPLGIAAAAAVLVFGTQMPTVTNSTSDQQLATAPTSSTADGAAPAGPTGAGQAGAGQVAPVPVVLTGDSVAHSLAGGSLGSGQAPFPSWEPSSSPFDPGQVRLLSIARPQCSHLPGRVISRSGGQVRVLESDTACGDWRSDLTSALDALDAKALVVVTTSDTYDRRVDGTDVVVGSAQWNEMYTEHLTWLSRTAADAGARLVLVTPVPRSSRFYVEADNESGWREQAVVDAMRNFAAGNPRTVVLDLWGVLCPTGDCDQLVEGFDPAWRYDGLHFDAFGARWFADWITPSLVTLETGLPPR